MIYSMLFFKNLKRLVAKRWCLYP